MCRSVFKDMREKQLPGASTIYINHYHFISTILSDHPLASGSNKMLLCVHEKLKWNIIVVELYDCYCYSFVCLSRIHFRKMMKRVEDIQWWICPIQFNRENLRNTKQQIYKTKNERFSLIISFRLFFFSLGFCFPSYILY